MKSIPNRNWNRPGTSRFQTGLFQFWFKLGHKTFGGGAIDEYRQYSRVLTIPEIQWLAYNQVFSENELTEEDWFDWEDIPLLPAPNASDSSTTAFDTDGEDGNSDEVMATSSEGESDEHEGEVVSGSGVEGGMDEGTDDDEDGEQETEDDEELDDEEEGGWGWSDGGREEHDAQQDVEEEDAYEADDEQDEENYDQEEEEIVEDM